jgi:hypothetical protein
VEEVLAQRLEAATRHYQQRRAELLAGGERPMPRTAPSAGAAGPLRQAPAPSSAVVTPPQAPVPWKAERAPGDVRPFQARAHVSPLLFGVGADQRARVQVDDADAQEATRSRQLAPAPALVGAPLPANRRPTPTAAALAALAAEGRDQAPQGAPPATLTVREGAFAGYVIALDGRRRRVGRGADNDVQILDRQLSRQHFSIEWRNDAYALEDAGSRNGTFVNGVRVYSAPLRSGDLIHVGTLSLEFRRLR